jgi:hypothetical protein
MNLDGGEFYFGAAKIYLHQINGAGEIQDLSPDISVTIE